MPKYLRAKADIEAIRAVSGAVKVVEKVAASRIHQLRVRTATLQQYIADVRGILADISSYYELERNSLLRPRTEGPRALIVVTGDHGLVGGLYGSLAAALAETGKRYERVAVIGERGHRIMEEEGLAVDEVLDDVSPLVTADEAGKITDYALGVFNGGAAAIDVLYPRFVSLAEQQPAFAPFLPFVMDAGAAARPPGLPIFEPSRSAVADRLLHIYISLFFTALLTEAKLSELSARTVATEHAGSQADDLARASTLRYFKERRNELSRLQIESFFAHKFL